MRKGLLQGPLTAFFVFISISCYCQGIEGKTSSISTGFFVQADTISLWGDLQDRVNDEENLPDGFNIPRARFFLKGKKLDWAYNLSFDASGNRFREAFLCYEQSDFFRITLGQFKAPYSFWFLSSIPVLNFMERALPINAFDPGFRAGGLLQIFPDPFTLSVAVIGPDLDRNIHNIPQKGHIPLAADARLTFSPIHKDNKVVHFAVASIFQDTDSLARFRFRSFPEIRTKPPIAFVDTGFIHHCKNYFGQECEFASILGPLTIEGEYYHTGVNRNPHDLHFGGYFITVDYFLTGEHYLYDFKEGDVSQFSKINHYFGAWQIAGRYSYLDLEDSDIKGGKERNLSFGLNWTPNNHLRFMLNYIHVQAFPSENGLNRSVNILAVRCQLSAQSL